MLPEIDRIERHAMFLDVMGACNRQINVASAAHVAQPRQCRFARDGCDVTQSLLYVCGFETTENFDRDVGVQLLKALHQRC